MTYRENPPSVCFFPMVNTFLLGKKTLSFCIPLLLILLLLLCISYSMALCFSKLLSKPSLCFCHSLTGTAKERGMAHLQLSFYLVLKPAQMYNCTIASVRNQEWHWSSLLDTRFFIEKQWSEQEGGFLCEHRMNSPGKCREHKKPCHLRLQNKNVFLSWLVPSL